MKKLMLIMLLAISGSITMVSCTEEAVTPTVDSTGGGGVTGGVDDKGKI